MTIKEMAEKAYPESKITRVNMFCLRQRDAYTKGANDVLEKIEKIFNESVNPSTYQDTYKLNKIHDLIIELKKG